MAPDILWGWSEETWFGWIGVQVFFVISGFVIAFSSEHASPKSFVVGRVLRLAPVMWISASVCLLITLYWQSMPIVTAIYLYLKSLAFAPFGPWIAGQIWTLPIEIFFYGVIYLLLLFKKFHRVGFVSLGIAVVSAVYWFSISLGFYTDSAGRITQLLLLQHGSFFTLGVGFWLVTRRGITPLNTALLFISVLPTWIQIKSSLSWEHPGFGYEEFPIVPYVFWVCSVVFMAATIRWNVYFVKVLSPVRNVVLALGRITYPLYLVHFHVGGAVMIWAYQNGWSPELSILTAFAASIAVASAIALWLERPLAAWLSKRLDSMLSKRILVAKST